MHADVTPTQDFHNFYLRWDVVPEAGERVRLEALGGPLALEIETSCYVDLAGNRHDTARVKVPIWPHPGERNRGQARFWDGDARRRFWVNLAEAVGTRVVDFLWETPPGSVPPEGVTIAVPEGVKRAEGSAPSAT